MIMAEQAQILFDKVDRMECASCHTQIDVSTLPAFTTASCPSCGKEVTVPGRLGNYLLLSCLGSGGMGSVYRAYDETLARIVAIKVMLKNLGDAPEFLESFRREAQAAAKLNHPNIAQIYSFGQEKGQPYIVMELVGGKHFDEMINEPAPLDQAMVMKIGMDIADGLQLAAASSLIHGDIKPENIILDERDTAKLLDFGIASTPNSQSTEIWGTPYYIAPEKLRRQRVDFRSDIYCLGGTLYHALTQHPPFEGEDAMAVVKARLDHPPEPMKTYRPDIDPEVEEIVMRMLQAEPAMRYPTYGSLLSDMRKYLSRVQPHSPSASTATNKRIVIKGRGKGAGSSTAASAGGAGGKHGITVSRGMVDPASGVTRTGIVKPAEPSAPEPQAQAEIKPKSTGAKVLKGCLIAVLVFFILLLAAGGGVWYYLGSLHKKAIAEYSLQIEKRDAQLASVCDIGKKAENLRDAVMAPYLAQADSIVSQALAAVEAEVGPDFTARIIYEPPYADEEEDVPAEGEESADDAENEGDAEDAEAEADDAAAEGEETPADEAETEETAEEEPAAEEKPAEGGDAAAEETPAENGETSEEETPAEGEESASAEPEEPEEEPLEGLPQLAREVFLALAPVREANHAVTKACDKITVTTANAEAAAQKVAPLAPGEKMSKIETAEGLVTVAANVDEINHELDLVTEIYNEAKSKTENLDASVRQAKQKLNELLAETSKLAAERKRLADEAEKQRLAEEAAAAKAAEEERIRQEKEAEKARIFTAAAANLENLRAFKFDLVLRELKQLENGLTYPESKKALQIATKRVECMKELKTFLISRMQEIPFATSSVGWSVKSASEFSLEIATKGSKGEKVTKMTWDKIQLPQMIQLVTFYLDREDNLKGLKLRQHVDALRNAAVYYMTFAPDNQLAKEKATAYVKTAMEKLPSRKNELIELLPELNLADGNE